MISTRIKVSKKSDSHNGVKESEMSFSRSSKEDLRNDVALDEVNRHITDAFSILRREISKVRKEKEAFEEVAVAGTRSFLDDAEAQCGWSSLFDQFGNHE